MVTITLTKQNAIGNEYVRLGLEVEFSPIKLIYRTNLLGMTLEVARDYVRGLITGLLLDSTEIDDGDGILLFNYHEADVQRCLRECSKLYMTH